MNFLKEKSCTKEITCTTEQKQNSLVESFHRNRSSIIFALSAPSGAGKTTVAQKILRDIPGLVRSVSLNTRKKREKERDGFDYIFVSMEEFNDRIKEDYFIEHTEIYGAKRGTPKDAIIQNQQKGLDTLCVIEWNGVQVLKNLFGQSVVSIFLMPPSIDVLRERLILRNQDLIGEIERRLEQAGSEMANVKEYDYCVVNDQLRQCVFNVSSIIYAERCKTFRTEW
jgi:guanylate kinase